MAWYSKIFCQNRGSHQKSRPRFTGSFLALKYRFLPHVLQMGNLFAFETVHYENMPKIIRHILSYLKQLFRFLPVHFGSNNP